MSTYNGFVFPRKPMRLPELGLVSERLIFPRIPFMKINRLRRYKDQPKVFSQVINVSVNVNYMVKMLPRNVDDITVFMYTFRNN